MEEITYRDAVTELEEILDAIEQDDVDLDLLADKVERASTLIALCRDKITATESKVKKVMATLEEP